MGEAPGVAGFLRWCDACVSALGAAREEIDALNVYPVPDGDTGTNLFLTFEAATAAARAAAEGGRAAGDDADAAAGDDAASEAGAADADATVRAFVDGALRGARGNSGVIMAQRLRAAVAPRLSLLTAPDGEAVAAAMSDAAAAAYTAVGRPVEGTILTVARKAAEAAVAAAKAPDADVATVVTAAADAARVALARTPEQLDTLRRAGVVDAGGRGLCVVLDATVRVLTGRYRPGAEPELGTHAIPTPVVEGDLSPDGPAYEVMYLLDADDDRIPRLRERLAPLGDSPVVVGGEGLWNVHVHVDDVGAAIEAGIAAGRPHRIAVTHFAEQAARAAGRQPARTGRGVVAMAAGPGLRRLFGEAGARVVAGGVGHRASTGEFLDAIRACRAAEVIVLPNDGDSIAVAEAAAQQARDDGIRVSVIPTRVQVQGLAALAVHEPGRSFDDDVVAMTTAAGHARHGAVTVASRRATTSAGPCEPGDVLGVLEGDFAVIGDDLSDVADQVVRRLLDGGGELLTLVTGDGAPDGLAERVRRWVAAERPEVDVVVYDGGQPRYPLLVGVE